MGCGHSADSVGPLLQRLSQRRRAPKALNEAVGLQEVVVLLNRTKLFQHLPKDQHIHVTLAQACTHEEFRAGDVIIRQGDAGNFFLAIRQGSVSVSVDGKKVATWGEGRDFGERSLLHDEPRQATLQAVTDVAAIKITREQFLKLGLNRKLQFRGRKAIRAAAATQDRKPTPKTSEERAFIAEALLANDNLQAMATLDRERAQKMADLAWKEHVGKGVDVIVEGDLAECFYVVQAGALAVSTKDAAVTVRASRLESEEFDPFCVSCRASEVSREYDGSADLSPGLFPGLSPGQGGWTPDSTTRSSGNRRRRYGDVIRQGGSFGELALLYNAPRFATVRAIEDSVLWGVDRKNFREILMGVQEEELKGYVKYLKKVGCLCSLQEDELRELAKALVVNYFKRGDLVVQQGEPSTSMHIVYEGQVSVIVDGKETRRLRAYPARPLVATGCFVPCSPSGTGPAGPHRRGGAGGTVHVVEEQALTGCEPSRAATLTGCEPSRATTLTGCQVLPCHADVKVVSPRATTLSLLRDSFDMLVGSLDDLEQIRNMRLKHRISIRTAAHRASVAKLLSLAPEREAYREKATYMRDLTKVRHLGSGQFGNVELWRHRDGRTFAMKVMSKKHIRDLGAESSIINERNVMLMTGSPFLVRLFEAYSTRTALYLLLEFASGGELHTVYNRNGFYGRPSHARFYGAGVALAFEHLHRLHVIHRDLKPENVLLDAKGQPKLADMGLAKVTIGTAQTFCGTPTYVAPEVIRGTGYTHAADWWSLGVLIYELLCGTTPFEGMSPMKIFRRVLAGVEGASFPEHCQGEPGDLIRSLLRDEPHERLPMLPHGLENLERHRWYRSFSWGLFRDQRMKAPFLPKEADSDLGFNDGQKGAPSADEEYEDDGSMWDKDFATVNDELGDSGSENGETLLKRMSRAFSGRLSVRREG